MWPRRSLSVLSTFSEVYPLLPPPEKKMGGVLLWLCAGRADTVTVTNEICRTSYVGAEECPEAAMV